MQFFSFLLYLSFTYIGLTNADVVGVVNLGATGCLFGSLASTPGFNARFYTYKYFDYSDISQTDYYGTSYLTTTPVNSTFGITDPQFIFGNTANVPGSGSLYGVDVLITNFLLELTGYFLGK